MFLQNNLSEITTTLLCLVIIMVIRITSTYLVKNYASKVEMSEHRPKLIIKYFDFVFAVIFLSVMIVVWSIDFKNLGIVFSSVFAVIGVALFAQWSILSNVTAGIILFFTIPYKIGDRIIIHDKDFFNGPLTITDIRAFHIMLKSESGEIMAYPNNLILQKGVTLVQKNNELELETANNKNLSDSID